MNHPHLQIDLPLPLSKNSTGFGKYKRNKRAVWEYRDGINNQISVALKNDKMVFKDKVWTFVKCWWRKPNWKYDHHNFYKELCDSIQVPLGVNDRYFLLHDMEVIVDKKNPGVFVQILQP